MKMHSLEVAVTVFAVIMLQFAYGEVYTAMTEMEELLYTERELLGMLDRYINVEEQRLERLKNYMKDYTMYYQEATQDKEEYLGNPVNAYLMVKRLTSDWREVENTMIENMGKTFLDNITSFDDVLKFPSEEDLSGAATALMRLQDTYNLDTSALARGDIQGVHAHAQLSAHDCFELGRQSYNAGDHYHTVLWMTEALSLYEQEDMKTVQKEDILEYLAFSVYMQGDLQRALELTNQLLILFPNHQRALGNKMYYEEMLQTESTRRKRRGDDGTDDNVEMAYSQVERQIPSDSEYAQERRKYEALCRGEKVLTPDREAALHCYYHTNNHPYLFLQPVKAEIAYYRPKIVIYHDVLSDNEVDIVKELATPRLRRATVQNYKTGELETAQYRISKSAWLRGEEHPVLDRVNRRIEHITGLNMDTAEELQVANYGLGGHYEPHFDFARKEEIPPDGDTDHIFAGLSWGNRIATWLFYMTDVTAGGATVFPYLDVSLWPKKGTAAFWYNLLKNGEGDLTTRHAACPVLAGTKWVMNKWVHERGQEWRRPCGLDFKEYE